MSFDLIPKMKRVKRTNIKRKTMKKQKQNVQIKMGKTVYETYFDTAVVQSRSFHNVC